MRILPGLTCMLNILRSARDAVNMMMLRAQDSASNFGQGWIAGYRLRRTHGRQCESGPRCQGDIVGTAREILEAS
jgi:hypothetical protein